MKAHSAEGSYHAYFTFHISHFTVHTCPRVACPSLGSTKCGPANSLLVIQGSKVLWADRIRKSLMIRDREVRGRGAGYNQLETTESIEGVGL